MLAAIIRRKGPPAVLEVVTDYPRPQLRRPRDVLVRVRATSVNPIDTYLRSGAVPMPLRYPCVLGGDACGVVAEVGADVTQLRPGDRVFGLRPYTRGDGCYAEYALFRDDQLAAAPAALSDAELASVPLVALTAWQGLFGQAGLRPGERVLIHGGSGGVGCFAIQLARHHGCTVYATSSPRNADLCRELGAHQVFDYATVDFAAEPALRALDVVFDTIGGYYPRSRPLLRRGSRFVGTTLLGDSHRADVKNLVLHGARLMKSRLLRPLGAPRLTSVRVVPDGPHLADIAGLMEQGRIRPVVATVLPLSQVRAAHELSQSRRTRGKIVLLIDSD